MRSEAATAKDYLESLPEEKRAEISAVREVILANLPEGYEESTTWGMLTYEVPLSLKPDTYNGRPLMYAGLAAQKNYLSLYLSAVYSDDDLAASFRERYTEAGKKLDMGKSCLRFKSAENLPLDLIGEEIARHSPEDFIGIYETARATRE